MAKVLVIEDNADNLRLIAKVLGRGGYTVASAANGTDGVALGMKEPFSFIVMDINLPDITGLEAARMIRETGPNKEAPIIAITSYAMRGDMARILEAGCNGYFEKPIDPLSLLDEIHRVIRKKK